MLTSKVYQALIYDIGKMNAMEVLFRIEKSPKLMRLSESKITTRIHLFCVAPAIAQAFFCCLFFSESI